MDVPWISRVSLASGSELHLVNISTTGLLVAGGTRFFPGSPATFRLWGPDTDLTIRARIVRSRATAGASGISHRVAATFDEPLPRLAPVRTSWGISRPTTIKLADLMTHVNKAAARGAGIRQAFEEGLTRFIVAREIRIRRVPVAESDGSESIFFTVPTGDQSEPILQATFEPDHAPRKDEFELLEAAATLAADVLDVEHAAHLPASASVDG